MKATAVWILAGGFAILSTAQTPSAPKHKPVIVKRLYTGPDGQTHVENVEAKFTTTGDTDYSALLAIKGAQLRRNAPGMFHDWHVAMRRQYAITLAGEEEIEIAGGKKILFGPGDIELAEDTTGKGHLSRTVGKVDHLVLMLPVADEPGR